MVLKFVKCYGNFCLTLTLLSNGYKAVNLNTYEHPWELGWYIIVVYAISWIYLREYWVIVCLRMLLCHFLHASGWEMFYLTCIGMRDVLFDLHQDGMFYLTCIRMRCVLFDMHQDEKSTQIRKIVPIFDLVFLNYFDVKLFAQVHSYDIRQ